MEELHKIEKPKEKKYFIAYNEDGSIKSFGEVNENQTMETICFKLDIFNEEDKPNILKDESNI